MEKAIKRAIEGGYEFQSVHFPKGDPFKQSGAIYTLEGNQIVSRKSKDGWDSASYMKISDINWHRAFLDPLFWQAIGKVEGWGKAQDTEGDYKTPMYSNCVPYGWCWHMHRFIDHIIEGKPIDDFFNDILKNEK